MIQYVFALSYLHLFNSQHDITFFQRMSSKHSVISKLLFKSVAHWLSLKCQIKKKRNNKLY